MEWLSSLFLEHSALQAVVVLSLISAIGLGLGRVHFWGISLGVTFVFFAGILAGHFGLSVDPQMLNYAESFGLVIFVYSLGLQVGPGFFSSFRKGGVTLNMLALGVVLKCAFRIRKHPQQLRLPHRILLNDPIHNENVAGDVLLSGIASGMPVILKIIPTFAEILAA